MVEALDGADLAHPGDWMVEGAAARLWPISARDAEENSSPRKPSALKCGAKQRFSKW